MKLSIKPTINKIKTHIANAKYEKKQNELNRLVNINEVTQPEAYEQLYTAREILANYAKANNLTLKFKTCTTGKNQIPRLSIWTAKNNHLAHRNINSDTKAVETVQRYNQKMLENKDGINYISKAKDTQEDNFIRRVYRNIESMKNQLNER